MERWHCFEAGDSWRVSLWSLVVTLRQVILGELVCGLLWLLGSSPNNMPMLDWAQVNI